MFTEYSLSCANELLKETVVVEIDLWGSFARLYLSMGTFCWSGLPS